MYSILGKYKSIQARLNLLGQYSFIANKEEALVSILKLKEELVELEAFIKYEVDEYRNVHRCPECDEIGIFYNKKNGTEELSRCKNCETLFIVTVGENNVSLLKTLEPRYTKAVQIEKDSNSRDIQVKN